VRGRPAAAGGLVLALVLAATASPALALEPGRWVQTGFSRFPLSYNQGITVAPSRALFFDGSLLSFNGLFKTDTRLEQLAGVSPVIPADVTARDGYNHIGDLSWDPGEGGRLLLPLECFTPGGPNSGNTCGTGAFAVADPATLQWRYYVKLDPADIPKAMWVESTPDGALLWTSAGRDLIAYRAADVNLSAAAPGGPLLRPVARLSGAAPPHGITGGAFHNGRLFLASNVDNRELQIWSVDTATGRRRLEIESAYRGEPEGLAAFTGLGGVLHAMILPAFGTPNPTFGSSRGALVQFAPAGTIRLRLTVAPGQARAAAVTRFTFRTSFRALGGAGPVPAATIEFAHHTAHTDTRGRATLRLTLPKPGRFTASARKRGFRSASAPILVSPSRPRIPFVG
jgi:hypothetical protein